MTATLTYNGPDANFFDTAFFGTGTDVPLAPTGATAPSSSFEVVNTETGATTTFGGTGVGYDSVNDVGLGVITSITFVQASGTVATITGINWNFNDFLSALNDDANGDETALLALFSDQDWTMSGATASGPVDLYVGGITSSVDLTGTPFGDTLAGGDSDDTIDPLGAGGSGGFDLIYGSLGNDTIGFSNTDGQYISLEYSDLSGPSRPITFNINDVTNTATVTDGVFTDTLINVSTVMDWNKDGIQFVGSWDNDTFNVIGDNESWTTLVGLGGNDVFNIDTDGIVRLDFRNPFGGAVDINLSSGIALDGLGGTDAIIIASDMTGRVEIRGTSFADTFTGSDTRDRFITYGGDDTVDGGAGFDTIRYDRSGVGPVEVDLLFGEAFGTWNGVPFTNTLSGIEEVRGSRADNDTISGNLGDNYLNGFGGDDLFFAGGGNNTIIGGDGTDTVYVGYSSTQMAVSTASGDVQLTLGGANTFTGVEQFEFLDQTLTLSQVQALAGQFASRGSLDYFGGDQGFFENAFFDALGVIAVSATNTSSTQFTAVNSATGAETIFTGSGFIFDLSGDPVDGIITGIEFTQGGNTVAEIFDVTWSLLDFVDALDEIEFNGTENILATLLSLQEFEADASTATDGANLIFDDVVSNVSITGSAFIDTISGGAGDDHINPLGAGGAGSFDVVLGSKGNDTIDFSNLDGQYIDLNYSDFETSLVFEVDETINTASVSDLSSFSDSIVNIRAAMDWNVSDGVEFNGGSGDDEFIVESGTERWISLQGNAGNDVFDVITDGIVRIDYNNSFAAGVVVNLETGVATDGLGGNDTIVLDQVFSGQIELRGTRNDDVLIGNAGNNRFVSAGGNDTIDGGGGEDLIRYDRNGVQSVNIDLEAGIATGVWNGLGFVHDISGVEVVRGSVTGNDGIYGNASNNSLFGFGGNDTLADGDGDDFLSGGEGDDLFVSGFGNDTFDGGAGIDTFSVDISPGVLPSGIVIETNLLTGYNGLLGGGSGGDVLVDIENVTFTSLDTDLQIVGNAQANRLQSADGNDTVFGDSGDDTILSGNNDDSISGGDGNDILNAGGGLDFLEGGAGGDVLVGGNGRDTAVYSNETVGIAINMATGSFAGGEATGDSFNGIEDIFGGSGDDTLTGDSGSNLLLGDVGADYLDGGTSAVRDVLLGGAQNDTLFSNEGNDILNGGGGNDRLTGGAGIDVLVGGRGNDIFTGGADRDIFVFQQGAWNTGVITDWGDGADRVRIVSNFGAGDVTLTQQGSDVLFTMTPTGDTILFQNTLVADLDLNSTDFIFI